MCADRLSSPAGVREGVRACEGKFSTTQECMIEASLTRQTQHGGRDVDVGRREMEHAVLLHACKHHSERV